MKKVRLQADALEVIEGRFITGCRGFTLVELVAVIIVLAVLAAVAVPRYFDYRERAIASATIRDLRVINRAILAYNIDTGDWPVDVNQGVMPPEIANRLTGNPFRQPAPLGGWYDWQGIATAPQVIVRGYTAPVSTILLVDHATDDGNLLTGRAITTTGGGGVPVYRFDLLRVW
jgi:prepilin-type N-terminal cleavage/methylation domain-containing protein